MSCKQLEKVYITRDEGDDFIWVWRKPKKGLWSPEKIKDCEVAVYHRKDRSLDNANYYLASDFKKKYGITIRQKTRKCVHLPKELLDSEDYKMISNDSNRLR